MSGETTAKRLIDWRARLIQYVVETASEPFEPGKNDCAMAAARAVEAMTGVDYSKEFGSYSDLKSGIKQLRAKGYRNHVDLVAKLFEEIPVAFAGVGDIVVLDTELGEALGIVQGEYVYVTGKDGRALVSLLDAKRAFRL